MNSPADIRQQFIEAAGHATQTFGFGRILGQIFMHIYFSPTPQSLDELTQTLGISKGSASMSVRQLEQWMALRRVWVKGDRKDYYETTDEFGKIIRRILIDLVGRKMEDADHLFDKAEAHFKANGRKSRGSDRDLQFLEARIAKLRAFRNKAQGLWDSPIIQMLLKK
jgi:DNA-binding transcriptional regulator GbsR (MarR family)